MEISAKDIKNAIKEAKTELSEEDKKKRRIKRIAGLALLGLSLLGMPFVPQLMSKVNAPAASAKLPSAAAAAQKGIGSLLKKLPQKKEAPVEEKPTEKKVAAVPVVNVAKAAADQPLQSLRMPFNVESHWENYSGGSPAITYNNMNGGGTVSVGVEGGSFAAGKNDTYFVYGEFGSIEAIQQQDVKYPQWDQRHGAIDFAAKMGTEVVSAAAGKVVYVGQFEGNSVIVNVGGGYYVTYSHLDQMNVSVGQQLNAGDRIGAVGNSGTTNPHLHFEVDRIEGSTVWSVNPHKFFSADLNKAIKVDAPANHFYAGDKDNAEAQPDFQWNSAWKGYFLAAVGK